jgi:hypothetical protein
MQDEEKTAPFPNPNVALGASKTGWDELDKQIEWGKLQGSDQPVKGASK